MATTFLEPGTDATQDLTFFPTTFTSNGTIASASDQAHTGTRSLKSNSTATNGEALCETPDGILADAGRAISIWVRLSSVAPSTATLIGSTLQAADGNVVMGLGLSTGGKLVFSCDGSAATVTGATTLSANTWFRLALSYTITNTTSWSAKVYLNGSLEISATNANGTLGAVTSATLKIGIQRWAGTFANSSILTAWYDDIYVDDRADLTDPGDIRVTAKRPISNGTTNGFTTQIGSGGSGVGTGHSPQVNEQPLSQTNGWAMTGAGSSVTEEYNIQTRSAGDVDLTGLTLYDYVGWLLSKAILVNETAQMVLGGSTFNIALTGTPTLFFKVKGSTTYPAGIGTDIGLIIDTTVTTVSLYECGVIVAYNPSAPTSQVPYQTYMVGILTQ
jgi:hypothetical protein